MSQERLHNVSAWAGIIGLVISLTVFFSAKPYLKDWFSSTKNNNADSQLQDDNLKGNNLKENDKIIAKSLPLKDRQVSLSDRNRMLAILNQYYQVNSAQDCNKLATFYLPVVENYFGKSNQASSDIIKDCIYYHSRWPIQTLTIDNSTFSVVALSNGDYFASYKMFYQVKKKIQDNWSNFNLTINVCFTPELKFRSMYEFRTKI